MLGKATQKNKNKKKRGFPRLSEGHEEKKNVFSVSVHKKEKKEEITKK